MEWTRTIKAVRLGDGHQWTVGDALIRDAGPAGRNLAKCSKELKALGFDYTTDYLRDLHQTAQRFPKSARVSTIAWSAHREAGNPENLTRAVKELRDIGKLVSRDNVAWLINEWQKAAEKARHRKHTEAKERVKLAGKKKAAAGRRKLSATSDDERKAAQAEFDQAKEEARDAAKELKLIPTEPIGRADALDPEAMPPKNDLELLALLLKVETNARLMLKTIETDAEALAPELERAEQAQINQIIKRYMEIETAVKSMLAQIRKHGFKAIQGGAAS